MLAGGAAVPLHDRLSLVSVIIYGIKKNILTCILKNNN